MIPRTRRAQRPPGLLAGLGLGLCLWIAGMGQTPAQPVASSELSAPHQISADHGNGSRYMGVRLLGALRLKSLRIDGQPLQELSGLAWDEDEQILYAVSDGGGLFHFRPEFEGDLLAGLAARAAYALRDAAGRPLRGRWADSEGLAIENGDNGIPGDTRLVVSFERRPRLARYSTKGRFLEPIALPGPLGVASNYASPNRSLESVTRHPVFGWLTAPERPMTADPPGIIRIWSSGGMSWEYPLRDTPNNALVAMEALADGSLVTLERGHGLLFYMPLIISLRRTFPLDAGVRRLPDVATAAVLNSSTGWWIDNFEGLTRHRGLRFFLVSDDNKNAVQVTILLYLEIVDQAPTDYRAVESDTRQENRH